MYGKSKHFDLYKHKFVQRVQGYFQLLVDTDDGSKPFFTQLLALGIILDTVFKMDVLLSTKQALCPGDLSVFECGPIRIH